MTVKSVLSAIKINAAALVDAQNADEAHVYGDTLQSLFWKLDEAEKTAPTAPTVEAENSGNISATEYTGKDELSSYKVGTHVKTPKGYGTINSEIVGGRIKVELDGGGMYIFEPWDLKEDKPNERPIF